MSALEQQIGGDHYKSLSIQPVEYIHRNGLGFIEGSVIKYVTRWRQKGGVADLEKARHFLDLLIQMEGRDQFAGMYQDAEGKVPVTEAGHPVGRVEQAAHLLKWFRRL
jgi:hypothetical protein